MARSMTGYGKSEAKTEHYEVLVEVRSLNNRYLDIGLKLPRALSVLEYDLKDLIKKQVRRGKLTVNISYKDLNIGRDAVEVNESMVTYYFGLLQKLKNTTGVKGEVTIDHLLQFKELFELQEDDEANEELTTLVIDNVTTALQRMNAMRDKEAKNLSVDILGRLKKIEDGMALIYERGKEAARTELSKLSDRLNEVLSSHEVDQNRLEQELALIADRVDVTEECMRLKSHLSMFEDVFKKKQEVGKKLTFILQEMHRESNTIGSKTNDIEISHTVINIKEEIEKLREQIQNLE